MNEAKKSIKQKPKYSIWQNTLYAFKNILQSGQSEPAILLSA